MTTIHDGVLHYTYEDENDGRLAIDRGPEGTANVSTRHRNPVAVLAEHVPAICRQLADKAGADVLVISGDDLMPVDADATMIRTGWRVQAKGVGVVITSPDDRNYALVAQAARHLGYALIQHADRAEKAASDAQVEELARILRTAQPGMAPGPLDGDYGLAVCRGYAQVVLDAGYRKQEPA